MGAKGLHDKHRERVRKEFLRNGFPEGTPEHKILEMLLFYSIPRKDTNELAHELLNHFGSFAAILDAPTSELLRFNGIGENTVALLKLIMPIDRCYRSAKSSNENTVYSRDELCRYITNKHYGYQEEIIAVTSLNSNGRIIGFDIIAHGDALSVNVPLRKLLEVALNRNASAVVLSHNHPDNNALPSKPDIETTIRVKEMLDKINVTLLDHIITVTDDYVSLALSPMYDYIFDKSKDL